MCYLNLWERHKMLYSLWRIWVICGFHVDPIPVGLCRRQCKILLPGASPPRLAQSLSFSLYHSSAMKPLMINLCPLPNTVCSDWVFSISHSLSFPWHMFYDGNFCFGLQILPPPITRSDFEKVLSRQRPTVSKVDLEVHEKFTKEFGEEGWSSLSLSLSLSLFLSPLPSVNKWASLAFIYLLVGIRGIILCQRQRNMISSLLCFTHVCDYLQF